MTVVEIGDTGGVVVEGSLEEALMGLAVVVLIPEDVPVGSAVLVVDSL